MKYVKLAFNAALRAAIEYYMAGKGDNKHSFSSERINNVMSRSIKLYTHNDTGHKSCKDTDNKATHNNTRNGNLIDIRDKARKCTWRYTNNDTRNICVMLHAIKPSLQMIPATIPAIISQIIFRLIPLITLIIIPGLILRKCSFFPTMIPANIASMLFFMIPATIPAMKLVMIPAKITRMIHTITLKITL